jgi:hypothetical protein
MGFLKVLGAQTARTLSYIGRQRRNTAGQHRVRIPPGGAPCAAPWPAAYACVSNARTRQGDARSRARGQQMQGKRQIARRTHSVAVTG